MELTTGQQRLLFVVVVLALAGLGIYLVSSRSSGGSPAAAPSATASTAHAAASGTTAAGVPPSTVPAATPVSTAGGAEIYQWLPFTAADLAAAAQTTVTFAADYATWSYTEDAAAYARQDERPGDRAGGGHAGERLRHAGRGRAASRGQAGVDGQRHDRLDQLVRQRQPDVDHLPGHDQPAGHVHAAGEVHDRASTPSR